MAISIVTLNYQRLTLRLRLMVILWEEPQELSGLSRAMNHKRIQDPRGCKVRVLQVLTGLVSTCEDEESQSIVFYIEFTVLLTQCTLLVESLYVYMFVVKI